MLDFTKELCPDRPLIHPTSQPKGGFPRSWARQAAETIEPISGR